MDPILMVKCLAAVLVEKGLITEEDLNNKLKEIMNQITLQQNNKIITPDGSNKGNKTIILPDKDIK